MWNRKRKNYNQDKLSSFLEDIEDNTPEMLCEGYDNVKAAILKMKKLGKSEDEIVDTLAPKYGDDVLGMAWVDLVKSGKMTESENIKNVSDAAKDTNKKVQNLEDDEESDSNEEEPDNDEDDIEEGDSFEIGDSEEDKQQLKEAQFARKDYNVVVDIIRNSADKIAEELKVEGKQSKIKEILAQEFADVFKADNPRFDIDRFLNALGD